MNRFTKLSILLSLLFIVNCTNLGEAWQLEKDKLNKGVLTVISTDPADGASIFGRSIAGVSITFSKAMSLSAIMSLSAALGSPTCSGQIQIIDTQSLSCLPFTISSANNDNMTIIITLTTPIFTGNFNILVKSGISSQDGSILVSDYIASFSVAGA